MAYVIEVTETLLRVLEHATPLPAHRLAGYAANADFWTAEIRHCRRLLDGYFQRYKSMKSGTDDYVRDHPIPLGQADSDTRTTRAVKDSEIRDARRRLDEISRCFFSRMQETGLLPTERLAEISATLGEQIFD